MKKSEPKLILNLSIEDEELENKIKIAMDGYAEDLVKKNLDDIIRKIVNERIDRLVKDSKWGNEGKIEGKQLYTFVQERTESVISEAIDKNIKDIFAEKIAQILSK